VGGVALAGFEPAGAGTVVPAPKVCKRFLGDNACRPGIPMHFANHLESCGIPTLLYTH
jgi:hypothetical protein